MGLIPNYSLKLLSIFILSFYKKLHYTALLFSSLVRVVSVGVEMSFRFHFVKSSRCEHSIYLYVLVKGFYLCVVCVCEHENDAVNNVGHCFDAVRRILTRTVSLYTVGIQYTTTRSV